ncbi:urokinase plasminogen activator surface receptor-like [Sitodiplosis mosellana]|uniref:urokinase plasminogen activator surface receptor-like n=1 Tax=Sitodiplosis mosellana TaxID=263140 RepID=UPI002443F76F|nr:urokinase plasminogen activator surface receptor-like [Sitodiplosis mosellana]
MDFIQKSLCTLVVILCVANMLVSCQQVSPNAIEGIFFKPWQLFRPAVIQPVKCFVCSSMDDGQTCVQTVSYNFLCESPSGMCYTNIVDGKVTRGCVGDATFPTENSIRKCADGVKCEVCNHNFCNQKVLLDTCIQCNSADSGNACKDNPSSNMQAVCTVGQNSVMDPSSGCYLGITGSIYQRGCVQDLKSRDKNTCESQSKDCKVCSAPNCNRKADFSINCFECSEKTDANCVEGENLKQVPCNEFSDTCVVGIDGDGFTHRRCIRNHGLALAMTFSKYQTCHTNLCNNQIFPENRLKCYQCQGIGCENLSTVSTPKACPNSYNEVDRCFTYADKDRTFYRGCMSDSTEGKALCEQNMLNCKVCDGSGCNSDTKVEFNSVSCNRSYITFTFISTIFLFLRSIDLF